MNRQKKEYELTLREKYKDKVEAYNKDEAAKLFIQRMPQELKEEGWDEFHIVFNHIELSLL